MGVAALASQAAGCFFRGDLLILQRFQDAASLLARLVAGIAWGNAGVIIATGGKAHGAEDVIQAGTDGGIRNPKLRLNILDDAAILDEDLDEGELLRREPLEAPQLEATLDLRLAIAALQTGYAQLVAANRAAAKDRVGRHGVLRAPGAVFMAELLWLIRVYSATYRRIPPARGDNVRLSIRNVNIEIDFIQHWLREVDIVRTREFLSSDICHRERTSRVVAVFHRPGGREAGVGKYPLQQPGAIDPGGFSHDVRLP